MRHILSAALFLSVFAGAPCSVPASLSGSAPAAAQPADDKALLQDPRVVFGELENGLRYVIAKQPVPPEGALLWLHVNAGTLNETDAQRGAARMVQHLAFDGSKKLAKDKVMPLLQELGNQPSADILSHCTFEETVFKLALKKATTDSIGKALDFLAEIPADLTLADADVEIERARLIEQTKAPTNSDQRIQDAIWSKLAPGTVFGQRLPMASEAVYKAVTAAECAAYYKKWYVPSNTTLLVVGDVTQLEVEEMIKAKFAPLAKSARPAPLDIGVKAYEKPFSIVATDAELDQVQVYGFRVQRPHPPSRTESQLRAKLVESLAIAAFNRRINEKIAGGKVNFVNGSAFAIDLANAATLIGVNASCDLKDWRKTLDTLATETQRMRLNGLLQSDIDDAKKQYTQAAETNARSESSRRIGTMIAGFSGSVNNGDAILSPDQTAETLAKMLPTITKEELDARFSAMFDPAAMAFVIAAPAGEGTPNEADLLKAGVEAFSVKPSADAVAAKPTVVMSELPKPGKIVSETTHEKTGVQTWTLDNGAVVHYLNTAAQKDLAIITVALAGGIIEEKPDTHGITEAGALAWSRPATSKLTSANIRELLQGKEVEAVGSAGVDNLIFGVSGKPANIEAGMQVAHLVMTDPFIEPPAFDQWRRNNMESAETRAKKPENVINDSLLALMFPESEFRLRPLQKQEVEKVTMEGATKHLKSLTANNPIEVSIVGDISKEDAQRLATLYVGSLPARPAPTSKLFADLRAIDKPAGPRVMEKEVPSLAQAAYLMIGFYAADENDIKNRRALFLARSIIEPRLVRMLKDQERIAFGAQVRFDAAQEFPGFGLFRAMVPVLPDKIDVAVTKILDTFTSIAEVGPTGEEIESVRKQALKALDDAEKNPNYWTGELSLLTLRGKRLDDIAGERAAYESITAADIRDAFASFYKRDNVMKLIMKPAMSNPLLTPAPPGGK